METLPIKAPAAKKYAVGWYFANHMETLQQVADGWMFFDNYEQAKREYFRTIRLFENTASQSIVFRKEPKLFHNNIISDVYTLKVIIDEKYGNNIVCFISQVDKDLNVIVPDIPDDFWETSQEKTEQEE